MHEYEGEIYLDVNEVLAKYGWNYQKLYYFWKDLQVLSEPIYFIGDKRSFWKQADLEKLKDYRREGPKRGPKGHALSKPVVESTGRARRVLVESVSALSTAN